ncbi:phage holin family protein [Erythrobacter sp. SDW2]|uniref:phage holin family protein n=1 Tax=Erythrobacter sp. SDW2 TaxID=2907154 RepID=UPI001F3B80C6|nr:phage holin family protein [Erythrobacter sp. SDW2]UIP05849.1 phage holin family protein [Erythrobacter sp. SDW2]
MLDNATHEAQPGELEPGRSSEEGGEEPTFGSLADDVSALIDDGKTYFQAEVAFQKTRASYAGEKTKQGVVFGLAALAFLHLALIALVVGLVIALGPYLTPFGAVAVVVGVLLLGVAIFAQKAVRRFKALGDAFKSGENEQS